MANPSGEYLNIEELAQLFNRSPAAIYTERCRGEGLGVLGVRVGKRLFWRPADIDAYFEQRQREQLAAVRG